MSRIVLFYSVCILMLSILQGCSSNGFHLRKSIDLPASFQKITLKNLAEESELKEAFELAFEESGGQIVESANTIIKFSNVREGKRVVAYNKDRKARVYLLFLKLEYEILQQNKRKNTNKLRINLDRSFVYDSNFALGKAEEENQIKEGLYKEAARLILLKLTYTKKK